MDSFVTPARWDQVVSGDDCLALYEPDRWTYGRIVRVSEFSSDRWATVKWGQCDSALVVAELHQVRVPRLRVEEAREARLDADRIDQAARILGLEAALAEVLGLVGPLQLRSHHACHIPTCLECCTFSAAEAVLKGGTDGDV